MRFICLYSSLAEQARGRWTLLIAVVAFACNRPTHYSFHERAFRAKEGANVVEAQLDLSCPVVAGASTASAPTPSASTTVHAIVFVRDRGRDHAHDAKENLAQLVLGQAAVLQILQSQQLRVQPGAHLGNVHLRKEGGDGKRDEMYNQLSFKKEQAAI